MPWIRGGVRAMEIALAADASVIREKRNGRPKAITRKVI